MNYATLFTIELLKIKAQIEAVLDFRDEFLIRRKNIDDICPEIMIKIFSYLTRVNLVRLQRVCKAWQILSNDSTLWSALGRVDLKKNIKTSDEYLRYWWLEKFGLIGRQMMLTNVDINCLSYGIATVRSCKGLTLIPNLKQLLIKHGNLAALPDTICHLTQLIELTFSFCMLKSIPEEIENLQRLRFLNLTCNNLKTLPSSLKKLTSLECLILDGNYFTKVPNVISELSLTRLTMNDGSLVHIDNLWKMTNLNELSLKNNKIATISSLIGNLIGLRTLNISKNKIRRLPSSIDLLTDLNTFYCNNNEISGLSDNFGQALTVADISGNKFSQVPVCFKRSMQLQWLEIMYNAITVLPSFLYHVSNVSISSDQISAKGYRELCEIGVRVHVVR